MSDAYPRAHAIQCTSASNTKAPRIITSFEMISPEAVPAPGQTGVVIKVKPSIILTGFFLCLVTGLPNLHIAVASPVASKLGVTSSSLFGLGGIVGGCQSRWMTLMPAVMLQLVTLIYLCNTSEVNQRYRDAYADSVG